MKFTQSSQFSYLVIRKCYRKSADICLNVCTAYKHYQIGLYLGKVSSLYDFPTYQSALYSK